MAKNTLLLYFRMLFTMVVALYTSRIVLEQLGIDDYGVYNVVGGIVTMFTLVSASMTSAIGRFITYELGRDNQLRLGQIFRNALTIQLILSLIVVILIETAGVWFLNTRMNIAEERMYAANWVLQCSVVTFIMNMVSVPYNSTIIAHEKMSAFAYISVLEVLLKLVVAYLLFLRFFDSLIWYAILVMLVSIIIRSVYAFYCGRHFPECTFRFNIDKEIFKSMLGYSGWSFIGSSSAILRDQGVNILLNIFCGSAVNAARGVATQVNSAVNGFSNNFMLAMNPQIIKSYASEDRNYMMILIIQGARLSLYMLLFLSLPIIIEAPRLLGLWLVDVPEHTVGFTRLVLVVSMIESLSIPLMYANQATGKIRNYQLVVGGIQLCNFPLAYVGLKLGFMPDCVYVVSIFLSVVALLARLIILRRTIALPVGKFLEKVIFNGGLVALVAVSLPLIAYLYLPDTMQTFIWVIVLCLLWSGFVFYTIGCNKVERQRINHIIGGIINRLHKGNAKSKEW